RKIPARFKHFSKPPIPGTARQPGAAHRAAVGRVAQQFDPSAVEASTMFENEKPVRYLWSFELHRQAAIERNLAIQACVRAVVRASAKWVRVLFVQGTRLARDLAAERRRRSAMRELQRLDDRMLKDIGIRRGEIEVVVRNAVAAAFIGLPIGGAMAADRVPWDCLAADLRAHHTDRGAWRGAGRRCRDAPRSLLHRDGSAQGLQSGTGRRGDETLRQHSTPPRHLQGRYRLNAIYGFVHGGPLATCIVRASRSMRTAPTVIARLSAGWRRSGWR